MSQTELEQHKAALETWKAALLKERAAAAPGNWHGDAEILDTDDRLRALRSEISIRGPPPPDPSLGLHGPAEFRQAIELSTERGRVVSYDAYFKRAVEQRRLIELRKTLISAPVTERPSLQQALSEQYARRLEAEAKDLNSAYDTAVNAEKEAYVTGRGVEGARAAEIGNATQKLLLRQAGALRALADSYKQSGVVVPGRLDHLEIKLPLASAVSHADLDPNAFTRISLLSDTGAGATHPPMLSISGRVTTVAAAPESLNFDHRFSRFDLNSAADFEANPIKAPGGVVVDTLLPQNEAAQLKGVSYDPRSHHFRLRIGDQWFTVEPEVRPEIARAALAFVLDGRVAAVDIGSFTVDVRVWLAGEGVIRDLTRDDQDELGIASDLLRVVRMNPALVNTAIGPILISTDELIFEALPPTSRFEAADSVFRGISTVDLHARRVRDEANLRTPDYKSILTVSSVTAKQENTTLYLYALFDYTVFALPRDGNTGKPRPPVRLGLVSDWFRAHDKELRAVSPELQRLQAFAVATAILRTAETQGLPRDRVDLSFVVDSSPSTPALLCRSEIPNGCDSSLLKKVLTVEGTREIEP
jgi:hypothetical protein